MKIYLIDVKEDFIDVLKSNFEGAAKDGDVIHVVQDTFEHFMNTHQVDCIVSPANSYGLMDGGYDKAITDYFGDSLIPAVQSYIRENYFCEQPVGTSFIIPIPHSEKQLIHTPTMRVPSIIKEPLIIYHCMRSTLICAIKNNVNSIVIPVFGGGCGTVPINSIARLMRAAYDQIHDQPEKMDWEYAYSRTFKEFEKRE